MSDRNSRLAPPPSPLLLAVADAWLPEYPPLEPADREAACLAAARFVDSEIRLISPPVRAGIRLALALLAFESALLGGGRFQRQGRAARTARLDRWAASRAPLRNGLARLLRSLLLLRFYDDPAVLRAMTRDGAPT